MADKPSIPVQPMPVPVQPLGQPVSPPPYPAGTTPSPQPAYQQTQAPQPVYVTESAPPVVYTQPAAAAEPVVTDRRDNVPDQEKMILYGHSSLFYWWPVWVVGYLAALLTWIGGQTFRIGNEDARFHTGNTLGVVFMITLFLVIMISNITLRGLASALVILGMAFVAVLFAYFGWWDDILNWFGRLDVFLNGGAYFWFSTLMFLVWAFTTFVFDRMSYWVVDPGQVTEKHVFGVSTKSYDSENMTFEKRRDDVFRHWILGMGSGDLIIHAFNAGQREVVTIPNVLFIGSKIQEVQRLIATEPTEVTPQRNAGR